MVEGELLRRALLRNQKRNRCLLKMRLHILQVEGEKEMANTSTLLLKLLSKFAVVHTPAPPVHGLHGADSAESWPMLAQFFLLFHRGSF